MLQGRRLWGGGCFVQKISIQHSSGIPSLESRDLRACYHINVNRKHRQACGAVIATSAAFRVIDAAIPFPNVIICEGDGRTGAGGATGSAAAIITRGWRILHSGEPVSIIQMCRDDMTESVRCNHARDNGKTHDPLTSLCSEQAKPIRE